MSVDRILCLANSYKHENRCVAGISLVTKKWIRLVGRTVPGCVTVNETCYADGNQAALLDVFEAEIDSPCGSNCHPEDVFVKQMCWRPIRRFDQPRDMKFLSSYVNKSAAVLQCYGDRIYGRKIAAVPVGHSLELIHPEGLWWWIREEKGKRKNRAVFRAGHVSRTCYNLAVTDPAWLERLRSKPPGIYPHSQFVADKRVRTLLTMSLSEPFEGFHYKLVAGVMDVPI